MDVLMLIPIVSAFNNLLLYSNTLISQVGDLGRLSYEVLEECR